MSGKASRVVAVIAAALVITGVALATPVPVLAMTDGTRELVARLDDGGALTYSYRQSIYNVPVYEDFVRHGDVIELMRVRSPDIRSIEYFHWDGDPLSDVDGLWYMDAPRSAHSELVIRIAPLGQQRITTATDSYALLPLFGETVVTMRVARRAFAQSVLEAAR